MKVNGPPGPWMDAVVASRCNLEVAPFDLALGTSTTFSHNLRIVGPVGIDLHGFNKWTDEHITVA